MEKSTTLQNQTNSPIKREEIKAKQVDTVSIVSLIDAEVHVTGTVTGKLYVFGRAGTVVPVDKLDANEILNKKKGRECCGGQSGKALFQLA